MPFNPKILLSPTRKLKRLTFQDRCVEESLETLRSERGVLLKLGTGLGKSIISSRIARTLIEQNLVTLPEDSFNPQPGLIICPKGIKIQWREVLTELGLHKAIAVISYGELANSRGSLYIHWRKATSESEPFAEMPEWDREMLPAFIIIDECQFIRKATAQRTEIARAIPQEVKVILMSATPFQTVSEARIAMELLGVRGDFNTLPCNRDTSATIASAIAHPSSPDVLVTASMERLRDYLTNGPARYQIEAPHARYPTKCAYNIQTFQLTQKQFKWYEDSYQRYLDEKNRSEHNGMAAVMVALNKLFEGAEILSARILCQTALDAVARGRQVIIAHCHKLTQQQIAITGLRDKYGFDISRFGAINGDNTPEENQRTKTRFNNGELDIITLAAGAGAEGLNLAHNNDSGRPRTIICPPWWSAIKLAQILGRIHRIDSISDAEVFILYPARTIFSERVMPRVALRLKCLKAAALAKESWMSFLDAESSEDGSATSEATGDNEEEVDELGEGLDAEEVKIVDEIKLGGAE